MTELVRNTMPQFKIPFYVANEHRDMINITYRKSWF